MADNSSSEPLTTIEELAKKNASETTKADEEIPEVETQEVSAEEWQKLKNEVEEFKNKYWLLLAESENARKRIQKERQELTKYAIQNIISELLHPLDTFENALKSSDQAVDEVKNWALGFNMILNQFKDMLNNHNVTPFSTEGKQFDPHFHEAVETEETEEYSDGTIVHEYLRGYKMGDTVIRPARVKVAKAPKQPQDEKENIDEEPSKEEEENNTNKKSSSK